jgi:hypothetical protein
MKGEGDEEEGNEEGNNEEEEERMRLKEEMERLIEEIDCNSS